MKATVDITELRGALKRCSQVSRKSQIPILNHVLIEADGGLRLTVTDMDIVYSERVEADASGLACPPLPELKRFVDCLLEGQLSIETDGNDLICSAGNDKCRLQTLPAEDFPRFNKEQLSSETVIPGFLTYIKFCLPAVETNETRPCLMGVHIEPGLRFVCTNGFQVHLVEIPATLGEVPSIIVPDRACTAMHTVLEGDALVRANHSLIEVSCGSRRLTSRLIDDTYPEYRRFVSDDYVDGLTVNRKALLAEVQRLSPMCDSDPTKGRYVYLRSRGGLLELAAVGAHSTVLGIVKANGEIPDLAFVVKHLQASLSAMEDDEIEISAAGPKLPIRFQGEHSVYIVRYPKDFPDLAVAA